MSGTLKGLTITSEKTRDGFQRRAAEIGPFTTRSAVSGVFAVYEMPDFATFPRFTRQTARTHGIAGRIGVDYQNHLVARRTRFELGFHLK